MVNLTVDFTGNGIPCSAAVELEGMADSWIAEARITGHPTISYFRINYRLGDFLAPMFVTEEALRFFQPLADALVEKAAMLFAMELNSVACEREY
jgi:hypothetical protein